MRLGVMTAGGDCPGLNAFIRAVVKHGEGLGHTLVGIPNAFAGLIDWLPPVSLSIESIRGILPRGGTVLGTSNRANPFRYPVEQRGQWVDQDVSDRVVQRVRELGLDGILAAGGDGTMWVANRLRERGVRIIGCPKTIDKDVTGTQTTFGFDTARGICTEAVDRLHTTAEAHQRVMVLEVMGRTAGFLALESGIAGGADVILLPEIAYRLEPVLRALERRRQRGRSFSIVVVAEGAQPEGGTQAILEEASAISGRGLVRLGGAGAVLAAAVARRVPLEVRVTVLGHLQRGGSPSAADRLLASRLAARAVELASQDRWGVMVAVRGDELGQVPLTEVGTRRLDPGGEVVNLARSLGICVGDDAG